MARDCPNDDGSGDSRPRAEGVEPGLDDKPRERYVPAEMLEGEDAFRERNETHSGSGINFDQYDKIPVKVSGKPMQFCFEHYMSY